MRRNIKIPFKLILVLIIFFILKNAKAQKNKNNTYAVSYGANLVFEDRNQFVNYINNKEVLWNISPITFGIEKKLNNLVSVVGYIGSNLYPSNQRMGGTTLKDPKDVFYFDIQGKLNLLTVLKYKSSFDPFVTVGTGYYNRNSSNEVNLNIGSGFNYWINDVYGINLNFVYKINEPLVSENTQKDLLQVSFMLVQTIK
jgi:hypothetical protein